MIDPFIAVAVFTPAFVFFKYGNRAPAQAIVAAEESRHIGGSAQRAETVGSCVKFKQRRSGWAFADSVDTAARLALRFTQAGCPAHDFDAVVKRGVGQLFGIVRIIAAHGTDSRIDTVFAYLRDVEASGLKAGLETLFVNIQPRCGFQCVFQRGRARIVHLFARNDADGLRRVFGGDRQAGGGGHGWHGITVARSSTALSGYVNGGQVNMFRLFGGLGGKLQRDGGKQAGVADRMVHRSSFKWG